MHFLEPAKSDSFARKTVAKHFIWFLNLKKKNIQSLDSSTFLT
jgi:hypothetical protein